MTDEERANLEALLEQCVSRLIAGGASFDFIAGWVAQRRCWTGIDRKANTA